MSVSLEYVSIFQDCDETTLKSLEALLKPVEFATDEYICRYGDPAKEMFFISSGQVEVIDSAGETRATIGEGEFFGEMGLVFAIPRTATIKAATVVLAQSLSKEDFNQARATTPSIEARVQEIAKFRFARFREELATLAHTATKGFTQDQAKVFHEVFSFWDRDNDGKLTKEETGEMMEVISGKKYSSAEIDQIIRMLDHDRDGAISYDDFRAKIWNLRWFVEPSKPGKPHSGSISSVNPESTPYWGRHWHETGCGEGAQYFLSKAFQWIETGDRIKTQGIYRMSGESRVVEGHRHTIIGVPQSITSILSAPDVDVHNVTSLVKLYFREMPEPLFPYDLYQECINAYRADKEQKQKVIHVINHLPEANRRILKMLSRHLNKVCSFSSKNFMTSKNMAIVFGPTLLRPLVETQDTLIGHSDSVSGFIQLIIDKPGKILADENMINFVPVITVNPHLQPSPRSEALTESRKNKDLKTTKKKKNAAARKSVAMTPANGREKDRRSVSSLPTPVTVYISVESKDEKSELSKLLEHMQTESKTRDPAKAILAYREYLYTIKLANKCPKCGKVALEPDSSYCSACGSAMRSGILTDREPTMLSVESSEMGEGGQGSLPEEQVQ
eukprot:TRINITY_DN1601_c0_g1_i2.p1 TRINITY_DN1601_c0_g1~~TRINITY_DN1601_c0_g1_i2.p1  ORF type:complete len:617 (+),score=115.58 TRINITY_DN1601_c0_g1_i2:63-1913(+)